MASGDSTKALVGEWRPDCPRADDGSEMYEIADYLYVRGICVGSLYVTSVGGNCYPYIFGYRLGAFGSDVSKARRFVEELVLQGMGLVDALAAKGYRGRK